MARGEIEAEDGVLVIRRIHVAFTLAGVDQATWPTVERVHGVYKSSCPVYRSIHRAIEVTTEVRAA